MLSKVAIPDLALAAWETQYFILHCPRSQGKYNSSYNNGANYITVNTPLKLTFIGVGTRAYPSGALTRLQSIHRLLALPANIGLR